MLFSSEPVLTCANRFEPTDQRAVSNRAYLSGPRVRKFFTLDTPVKPTAHTKRAICRAFPSRAKSRGATHQRPISPHRSPPRDHHVLGVVRHRRPVVFLREEATEAIHDPSWLRVGREESEGQRAQAACHGHRARVALVARVGGGRRRLRDGVGCCRSGGRARPCPRALRGTLFRATQSGQPSSIGPHHRFARR